MKLKFKKNHITFKLSKAEKKELSHVGQSLKETLIFPGNHSLTYILSLTSNESAKCSFINNEITLHLPWNQFELLSTPSKQGISFDFESLSVSVEVDLLPRIKHAI
ncbi:MAG: hypothetical protein HYX60_06780 [Legionella longbeachae]|nr:hypothetical protein [Legionella longbeachae]